MKNNYVFIALLFLAVLSCKKQDNIVRELKPSGLDTLKANYHLKSKECINFSKGYYEKYGILISNYYEENSSILFDFDNDGEKDVIAIFSPFTSIPMTDKFSTCFDKKNIDDRLLVFIKKNRDGSKLYKVYKNVVSNEISVAWEGAESLKFEKDGFYLIGDKGQGCKIEYSIFFKKNNNNFQLKNIDFSFSCPNKLIEEKKYDFSKRNMMLDKYRKSIIDSLKSINGF